MCKFNPKNDSRFVDPCMKNFIETLNKVIDGRMFRLVASCCGHGKYPTTVVYSTPSNANFEMFSGKWIPRTKKFYKKDKQGYYYIPEVCRGR